MSTAKPPPALLKEGQPACLKALDKNDLFADYIGQPGVIEKIEAGKKGAEPTEDTIATLRFADRVRICTPLKNLGPPGEKP